MTAAKNEERETMAKKNGTAEPAESTALALTTHDELAGVIDDLPVDVDGLEEIGAEDVKLAARVWNFKGIDSAGDPIPPNVFYDTIEETTKKELDLALLVLHKTNEWREYDEAEGASKIRCRSQDRVVGVLEDGTERACQGCPDAEWRTDERGKRGRKCGPVYNTFAIDRESGQPCVLRFKRTSLPVIQSHLNKHHIGRRVVNGSRSNYPLFAFRVKATLKMSDDKKYAIPVLEKAGVLTRQEIEQCMESARFVRERLLPELDKVAAKDADDAGAPRVREDASFNPSDFADTSASANGNRF